MSGADGDFPPMPRWYGQQDEPGADNHGNGSAGGGPSPSESGQTGEPEADGANTDQAAWQQAHEEARQERAAEQAADQHGEVPNPRDAAREVGSAWFGRDLIEPGPGVPFGGKARERRHRRKQTRQRTKERRAALRQGLDPEREPTPMPSRWRPVDRRANAKAIASLTGVVAVVLALAWWFTSEEPAQRTAAAPPAAPAPPTSSAPPSSPGPAPGEGTSLPKLPPIPPGGVAPIVPPPPKPPVDPDSVRLAPAPSGSPSAVELSSPESAATAWFARWCPFDYHEPYGTSENAARPAMTAMGWDSFDPAGNERGRMNWDKTVAAQEIGRCSAPQALVSPEAPRSANSAIVIVHGQRVITGPDAPPYVEKVTETRIVKRESDGLWRVDSATRGG